jgi:hypothetical protein
MVHNSIFKKFPKKFHQCWQIFKILKKFISYPNFKPFVLYNDGRKKWIKFWINFLNS